MKKSSTSFISQSNANDSQSVSFMQGGSSPKQQTIDFLKQFARSYHAEPALGNDLCGFLLN